MLLHHVEFMDWPNAALSMDMRGAPVSVKGVWAKREPGSINKSQLTMPSIESAYLNLNLYANTNPNFQRNVIEKMMEISKKMQNS